MSVAAAALREGSFLSRAVLVLITLVKVGLLGTAARWTMATRSRLDASREVLLAWSLLGASFLGFSVAHVVLGVEQLAFNPIPYPSVADALFTVAQILLVAALVGFVGAYRSSGFFSEEGTRRAWVLIGALAVVIGGVLVGTIERLPVPRLERATDDVSAVLDLAVLVPLGFLMRQARTLGGQVGRVWALLLAGFAVFSVADVTFGYLNALNTDLPLLVDQFPFVIAYGLVAAGSRLQLALVSE